MDQVLLATSIAAVTEFIKRASVSDWKGCAIIACATAIGLIAGAAGFDGLTVQAGLITALGIVGIHTIAQQVG